MSSLLLSSSGKEGKTMASDETPELLDEIWWNSVSELLIDLKVLGGV